MTTIVCNRFGMAADTLISSSVNFRATKIYKVDGSLIATSGDVALGNRFVAWRKGWKTATVPLEADEDFQALELTKDGRILYYSWQFEPLEVEEEFYGIGSGAPFAVAAMACGFPMEEAILVAAQFDEGTGEEVQTVML